MILGVGHISTVPLASTGPTTSFPTAAMGRKGGPVWQPISPAGHDKDDLGEQGFTLLEVVCVLAIIAMIAAIALPLFREGRRVRSLRLMHYPAAAVLKADRNAAVRRQTLVATEINAPSRSVRSGIAGRVVRVANDVEMNVLLPARCSKYRAVSAVVFFPSGMSCGGVVTLARSGVGFEVRVNWLTGGVDIVPFKRT